jgi:multiple sugar transport system substrate-binding protein
MRYKGLTWDHPRGYRALRAAAAGLIDWDVQPLEGFEAAPIADLCARYDLVVMDHPHVGEAVAAGCLRSIEDLLDAEEVARIGRETIGPCFASYAFGGRHWALPLDAAAQVTAYRPDLIEAPPRTWEGVIALSTEAPVVLSLAGPHAVLTFQSIAVALGELPAEAGRFVSAGTGAAVLDLMATLAGRAPGVTREMNPIGILEHMAWQDDAALCPLVYGYVNYAAPGNGRGPLRFADAPRAREGGRPGSTLGGTGVAVSTRAEVTPALLDHLRRLMAEETQTRFIPAEAGQPSNRAAWADAAVNAAWGNFYRDTAETLERAYVRPRHPGAIAFQTRASALIRDGLAERRVHAAILDDLQRAYADSRQDLP